MEIKTKYNIGDKVFWIEKRDGIWSVKYDPIKSINIGGKSFNKYEISYTLRGEVDLWLDFDEAKSEAHQRQEEANQRYLEIISEYKSPL